MSSASAAWRYIAVACVVVSAAMGQAHAAKKPALPAVVKKPADPTPSDAAKDKAKPFATEGKRQYKLGRFDESLAAYSKAYEIYPAPALLFNLGQCEKNLGHFRRAIFFFEGYLRDEQRPEARATAQDLVKESKVALEKQQAEQLAADEEKARQEQRRVETEHAIASTLPAPGLTQPMTTPVTQRKWFWPVVGTGAAIVVGVAAFFVVSYAIAPHPPKTGLGTVAIQ